MTNKKITSLLTNNWVITLTATLIGVFLALYLNEWVASNNLNAQKEIATKNIVAEIASNQKNLEKSIIRHTEVFDIIVFLSQYVDEADNLIAPPDSMNKFRNQYPTLIVVQDSTLLNNGNYHYKGEINSDLSVPHLELTTIAWKTVKNSGFSTTYGFECLMYLESIDKLVTEVSQKDKVLFEYMTDLRDSGVKNKHLINHLKFLIGYEKSLRQIYERNEEELKNCSS